jgi:hypothetical protein
MVYRSLLAVVTEVWSLLVPMKPGHLVFVNAYKMALRLVRKQK